MDESNKIDATVLKSLKKLGYTLRSEKFKLRNFIQEKRKFKKMEIESRQRIEGLINKINWELSENAKIQSKDKKD